MNKRTRKPVSLLTLVGLMSVTATAIVTAASPLRIDSFSSSSKWSNRLNNLNQSVSWSMDSVYYGNATPGEIVMNYGGSGQYYQETIAQSISGGG